MKSIWFLACALVLASCNSDGGSADAAPIVLDDEDAAPGAADANVNNPNPPDANVSASACDMGTCQECQQCSMQTAAGTCMDEASACAGNQQCIDLINCLNGCTDQPCVDNCAATYPNGVDPYITLASCVICDDCYTVCDGAGAGCM